MKKKADVVKVDDNGKVVEDEKKKIDWKDIGKKALIGLACAVGGVIAFVAVGAAMCVVSNSEESDDSCDSSGDDSATESTDSESVSESEE